MIVNSNDIQKPTGWQVSVDPDNQRSTHIKVTFTMNESVEAEQSTAQDIADLIKGLLADLFSIAGDGLALAFSPGTLVTSALAGKPPAQATDIVDKSADIARIINKFIDQSHEETVSLQVPVRELDTTFDQYSLSVVASGTTDRGGGKQESATVDLAVGWLGALQKQGGIRGGPGAQPFKVLGGLTGQTGKQGFATPGVDLTLKVNTDGDPNAKPKRHSEIRLTKVEVTLDGH